MAIYSIKDLEKLSGIKAHTIRIWERRYNLVKPRRTPTNIRYYSDDDLKRILNISILNQNGFKISKIAYLDDDQLRDRVIDLCLDPKNTNVQIESLLVSMLELDEIKFTAVLTHAIIKQGFETVVESILFPFLNRIGILWQAGTITPSQEHFISNLIRQKLIVAIDNEMQNILAQRDKRIVFFLPENEWHEIGLLFYSLLARKESMDVIYLGASVPLYDLKVIHQIRPTQAFFLSVVAGREKEELDQLLIRLSQEFPGIPVFINGLQVQDNPVLLPPLFHVVATAHEFKTLIREL
ncbi:MerR family transcriptional regulator [Marinilabiliaceae bacterium JC017]|nr:MerR family transcriptional regulator [Marinilabiliaceae bacterium JC017]